MSLEMIREILGWCTLINFALLTFWFAVFALARSRIYRLHSKWFALSEERFDAIHYAGMAFFKLSIFLLNLAPYLALRIAV
ncbi:MAG: DUF6868 family protein [Gammaproteobacteria bacterium]